MPDLLEKPPRVEPPEAVDTDARIEVHARMWRCDACQVSVGFRWYEGMRDPPCKEHGPMRMTSTRLLRRITPAQMQAELAAILALPPLRPLRKVRFDD